MTRRQHTLGLVAMFLFLAIVGLRAAPAPPRPRAR